MGWIARVGTGIAAVAIVLAACGSSLAARTFEVTAPGVQHVPPYPVVVTDRSGQLVEVDVQMVAVSDDGGFPPQDGANDFFLRRDQVLVMWPGGGCGDRGSMEVDAAGADRFRVRLIRITTPCAITVMDRVLLTFSRDVDARDVEVEHVAPPTDVVFG